ncbi:MAG TPA: universal stress protein [Thermoleophilaceae bacterium]|nr:universal stress protein [Thermoleophilaceae bacterium]
MSEGAQSPAPGPLMAGYDGRAGAHDALVLADALAIARGKPLIAAHISEALHPFGQNDRDRQRDVMERLTALRAAVDETLPERRVGRPAALRDVSASSAARGLRDLAVTERAHAIVLGSTHHGPIGRVSVGTTAARLLVKAPCAVAVAPTGFRERRHRSLENVAVAVDGCRHCQGALQEAMSLTAAVAGRLVALAAVPPSGTFPLARRSGHDLLERVDSMLERSGAHGVERVAIEGAPAAAISKAAEQFDVLIVGCRSSGGALGHPTVQSVSRSLMHSLGVPLIVIPETAPVEAASAPQA